MPKASVLPLSVKVKACGTVAETAIWSSAMIVDVNVVAESTLVATVPVTEPAPLVVSAAVFVQLKQYVVDVDGKLPLDHVTVRVPELALVAVAPMLGQATALAGQPVVVAVLVAQLAVVALTVKPVGNTTVTDVWPVVADLAQTKPVVAWEAPRRSKRTITCVNAAACACDAKMTGTVRATSRPNAILRRPVFIFVYVINPRFVFDD